MIWNNESDSREASMRDRLREDRKREWLPRKSKRQKEDDTPCVIIGGSVHLYGAKAPYVKSGESIGGALEYRRSDDKVKCHECGKWMRAMGAHLTSAHGMTAREYKIKHGLRIKSALCGDRIRAEMSSNMSRLNDASGGTPLELDAELRWSATAALSMSGGRGRVTLERRNLVSTCPAQLIERLRSLSSDLGRTPRLSDIEDAGLTINTVKYGLSVSSLGEAMRLAGLKPNPSGVGCRYSPQIVIELGRKFIEQHGRMPVLSDAKRGLIPSPSTIRKHLSVDIHGYVDLLRS